MLTGGRRPVVGDINMLTLKRAARTHMHPHRNRRRLTYTPEKKQERTSRKMLNTSRSFSVTMSLCCFNTCTKDVVFVIFPSKEIKSVFKCMSRRVRIMTPLMFVSPLKCLFYLAELIASYFGQWGVVLDGLWPQSVTLIIFTVCLSSLLMCISLPSIRYEINVPPINFKRSYL